MQRTVMKMAAPGIVTVYPASSIYDLFDPITCPQLTTLGSVRPRKLSPASNKIAEPTIRAACTMIGGRAFGKIILNINIK